MLVETPIPVDAELVVHLETRNSFSRVSDLCFAFNDWGQRARSNNIFNCDDLPLPHPTGPSVIILLLYLEHVCVRFGCFGDWGEQGDVRKYFRVRVGLAMVGIRGSEEQPKLSGTVT